MQAIYISASKGQRSEWGWGAIVPGVEGIKREVCGTIQAQPFESLLQALIGALQDMSTRPLNEGVVVVIKHEGICTLLNHGSSRWSKSEWRKAVCADVAGSPLWRKLAKASRRFTLTARLPHSLDDHEMTARAEYYSQCALGSAKVYKLYTDGSFVPKTKRGGWAAILEDGKLSSWTSGWQRCRDCNEAELLAVIHGLRRLDDNESVIVFTDSRFVVMGSLMAQIWPCSNWRTLEGKRVLHKGLWEDLYAHMRRLSVRFEWIKCHSGIEQNYRADLLAKRESKNLH